MLTARGIQYAIDKQNNNNWSKMTLKTFSTQNTTNLIIFLTGQNVENLPFKESDVIYWDVIYWDVIVQLQQIGRYLESKEVVYDSLDAVAEKVLDMYTKAYKALSGDILFKIERKALTKHDRLVPLTKGTHFFIPAQWLANGQSYKFSIPENFPKTSLEAYKLSNMDSKTVASAGVSAEYAIGSVQKGVVELVALNKTAAENLLDVDMDYLCKIPFGDYGW